MKSQTDLIVLVVAAIFTIGAGIGLWFTKRDPVVLSAPTEVNLAKPAYPAGDVAMSDSLPGGSTSGGGGAAARGGFGGGPPGAGAFGAAGLVSGRPRGAFGGGK